MRTIRMLLAFPELSVGLLGLTTLVLCFLFPLQTYLAGGESRGYTGLALIIGKKVSMQALPLILIGVVGLSGYLTMTWLPIILLFFLVLSGSVLTSFKISFSDEFWKIVLPALHLDSAYNFVDSFGLALQMLVLVLLLAHLGVLSFSPATNGAAGGLARWLAATATVSLVSCLGFNFQYLSSLPGALGEVISSLKYKAKVHRTATRTTLDIKSLERENLILAPGVSRPTYFDLQSAGYPVERKTCRFKIAHTSSLIWVDIVSAGSRDQAGQEFEMFKGTWNLVPEKNIISFNDGFIAPMNQIHEYDHVTRLYEALLQKDKIVLVVDYDKGDDDKAFTLDQFESLVNIIFQNITTQ